MKDEWTQNHYICFFIRCFYDFDYLLGVLLLVLEAWKIEKTKRMKRGIKAILIILVCAIGGIPISIWNETMAIILLFSGVFYVIFVLYGKEVEEVWKMINETLFIAYDMGTSSLYEALYFILAVILFFVILWFIRIYNQKQGGIKDEWKNQM